MSLRTYLAGAQREVSTVNTREIALQIFRGLAYMHSRNVVHRNIRPENIVVNSHDGGALTVLITDFAQSRIIQPSDIGYDRLPLTPDEISNRGRTDKELTRLVYRSPEQLLRLNWYDEHVDVWSAGVVLLEVMICPCPVPWAGSSSESECLMRITQFVGTPAGWPELDLSGRLWNWAMPVFPAPPLEAVATTTDRSSPPPTAWHTVVRNHGMHAVLLIGRMLAMDPATRVSISECLSSGFVMGDRDGVDEDAFAWFRSPVSGIQSRGNSQSDVSMACIEWSRDTRLEWIGGWLYKISQVIDCMSSRPVHTAVAIFNCVKESMLTQSTCTDRTAVAVLLTACVKVASRFYVSKDMFKQVHCRLIEFACDHGVTETAVIAVELQLLTKVKLFVHCFGSLLSDPADKPLRYLAEYITDLCLLDKAMSDEFSPSVTALAAVIVASQWNVVEGSPFARLADPMGVSLDTVQMAVSKCVSLVTERRAKFMVFDNQSLMRIIESNYRLNSNSAIPPSVTSQWRTSRNYIQSILSPLLPVPPEGTPCTPLGAQCAIRQTPPKQLFRSSTLQHAHDWAIESRRRSRSSVKKRSRSATPMPCLSVKRRCIAVESDGENVDPVTNVRPATCSPNSIKSSASFTPRRSARLAGNQLI